MLPHTCDFATGLYYGSRSFADLNWTELVVQVLQFKAAVVYRDVVIKTLVEHADQKQQ